MSCQSTLPSHSVTQRCSFHSSGRAIPRRSLARYRRSLSVGWLLSLLSLGCSTTGAGDRALVDDASTAVRGQDESWTERLDPQQWFDSVKEATGFGPDREIAEQAFQKAEARFVEAARQEGGARRSQFKEAASLYKTASKRWPDSALEEDALFMLSECYFFADNYPDAASTYERLIKKYPNTRHMDTVDQRRFAMARYWLEHHEQNPNLRIAPNLLASERPVFDTFGHGIRVLDKIRFDDPTGKLADDATMAAGLAYFKRNDFIRADELFTDLRRSFPNSEHQFRAHLLGLQCKVKIYQGPQYSLQPMDEAEQLVKQIHRQFPKESEEHREFLAKAWQEVRLNKAQHDWEMAKYYHRRKEHAAARQYYERVRQEYGDTSLAEEAREQLASIQDAPDKPSQPLPWVAQMFPTPDREKPLVARSPLGETTR